MCAVKHVSASTVLSPLCMHATGCRSGQSQTPPHRSYGGKRRVAAMPNVSVRNDWHADHRNRTHTASRDTHQHTRAEGIRNGKTRAGNLQQHLSIANADLCTPKALVAHTHKPLIGTQYGAADRRTLRSTHSVKSVSEEHTHLSV